MDERFSPSRFTREQKTGLVFLFTFGLLAVGLGALQMRNTIYGPFVIHADTGPEVAAVMDENERLQHIDTDHDGLNDYEELKFYTTSPYLPDTDSDGIPDKTEIDRGTDPLCVEGKACTLVEESVSATSTFLGVDSIFEPDPNAPNLLDEVMGGGGVVASATDTISVDVLHNPQALRKLLLESGSLTKEQLDTIDDATLLKLAEESRETK